MMLEMLKTCNEYLENRSKKEIDNSPKCIQSFSDRKIVEKIISNDETIIRDFFYVRCRPMFIYIIKNIFNFQIEYDELVNELYLCLRSDDWKKLRQFGYRCKLISWLSFISIRFFREKQKEWEGNKSLIIAEIADKEDAYIPQEQQTLQMDMMKFLREMPNQRYRQVIQSLFFEDIEPQQLADEMGITIENLYNIKRRALEQFARILRKELYYVG